MSDKKKCYGFFENAVLVQKQFYPQKGFVEISADAVCGQVLVRGKLINPENPDGWLKNRIRQYPPVTDQLDALMKWLATENEVTIPEELKSIAMKCMSVKAHNPKPE